MSPAEIAALIDREACVLALWFALGAAGIFTIGALLVCSVRYLAREYYEGRRP